jgi:asparagine synthase (glutamine-hydrolysing)
MCGIHGIVTESLPREEIKKRLEEMGDLQRHRGPDDKREEIFSINGNRVGLGLVRLSILDLETGMQPIICKKDHSAIVCNGQIYNYIELRPEVAEEPFISKGDIEVVLHLYRVKGIGFLNYLNGMFAGAIYDPSNNRLLLFRDRFGIKPLYYMECGNEFFFSSEIKPLLAGSGAPVKLNKSHLTTFLTYRYVPGEETMFQGIKRLQPGSYLDYDITNKSYKIIRYWEYRLDREETGMSLDDASARFVEIFEDAVRIRLRSDVEVGSLLSGGIDSSAVSSISAGLKPDIKFFSISFKEDKYNELPQIRRFLEAKGDLFGSTVHYSDLRGVETLEQLPDILMSLEEPISLGTILPTDQICKMAGSRLKVVMTGEGADEIFAGYRKFLIETAAHQYKGLSEERKKDLERTYPELAPYMAIRAEDPDRRYIQSESLFSADELKKLTGLEMARDLFPPEARPHLGGNEHQGPASRLRHPPPGQAFYEALT